MGETLDIPAEDPAADPLADALKRIAALERVTNKLAPIHPGFCVPATGSSPASLTGEQEVEPMWLLCNGAVVSQTKWPQLAARYEQLGFPYNTGGEAADEMRLPDLTAGRSPVGKSSSGTFVTVGAKGGAETKTLSTTEIPSHSHTITGSIAVGGSDGTHGHSVTDPGHGHSGSFFSYDTVNDGAGSGNAVKHVSGSSFTKAVTVASGTTGISVSSSGSGHGHSASHSLTAANTGGGSSFSLMNPYQVVPGWLVYAGPPQE